MLYYKEGTIPNYRPKRLRLDNGLTLTEFDDELLFSLGWKIAPEMPEITYPNQLTWNGSDWVITPPSEADIATKWESVKATCQRKLAETDYKVIKAVEMSMLNGTTLEQELPIEYVQYRQALRDIYNNVGNLDPYFITWPVLAGQEVTTNGN